MIDFLWHDLLYVPLYNLLVFFYHISPGPDMGLAVVFLTVFIRVVLLPFSIRSARAEHRLDRLRPLMDDLNQRYKYDLQKQREATKKLLQRNKIGVYSNFFSLIFQVIFFLVLYTIFSTDLQPGGLNELYAFNFKETNIDPFFLGRLDLTQGSQAASLFAAGVVFFHQAIRKVPQIAQASTIDKVLLFGLPIGTYIATIILPSSKAVFITTSVLFTLWIRLIKWLVVKFLLKDQKLKASIDEVWTN
jgi:YidC/Oxa1 family membrane protein insertase